MKDSSDVRTRHMHVQYTNSAPQRESTFLNSLLFNNHDFGFSDYC